MYLSTRIGRAIPAACCFALAVPTAASAATRVVSMGVPPGAQQGFAKYQADVNDYFPHGLSVHVGDSVKFVPNGAHTVDLLGAGDQPFALIVPNGNTVSGANDAAGSPFWFNGADVLGVNPALIGGSLGKRVAYDGSKRVSTGLPLGAKPKPMVVKFTRKGSFTYFCNIHVGMKGRVRVLAKRARVPSARSARKQAKAEVARDLRIAGPLANATLPAGTFSVGSSGAHGVEYFGFVPSSATVPVGTTVQFRMSKSSFEGHTVTTGPGDPQTEPDSYLGKLSASFGSPVLDPAAAYPSDPPGSVATLTPTQHGNGFWNSGTLDNSGATPLPPGGTVKLGAAGTYDFYCLIHPIMHARVVVQ